MLIPIRFNVAAMSSSDHRPAMLPMTGESLFGGAAAMLAGFWFTDAKLRVLAAAANESSG